MKKVGFTLLAAFVGGAVAIGSYKLIENKYNDGLSFEEKQKVYFANNPGPVVSSADNPDFTQAAAAVTPAVVHIKTTYSSASRGGGQDAFEDMFEEFFGGRRRPQGPQMASGSGVIISDDGYIVTNNHVVDDASKIEVVLNDKRSFSAKVIGRDPNTDLALIKISGSDFPLVKFGNSDNVQVGEWVLAVGNPFNLTSTVTAGIVSAKGRSIGILGSDSPNSRPIEAFIQTDAAINRGNSGGALVNTKGELIGINAAIASQTGNYEGYGFAIPINLAKKVIDDFIKFGTVQRGFLGVSIQDVTAELAKEKELKSVRGIYVQAVVPGGAAGDAGIKEGDVITKVAGVNVNTSAELQEQIGRHAPGDKIGVTVVRGGSERVLNVTLSKEQQLAINRTASSQELYNKLGASFAPLTSAQKSKYRVNSGVIVSQVRRGGFFAEYGIPQGMVITSINDKAVNNADDIDAALGNTGRNNMVRISGIAPDGSRVTYNFQVN
ncbi:MAG TPA: Do family serine endopeptidase [Sphingobacteriaceae bacterium]